MTRVNVLKSLSVPPTLHPRLFNAAEHLCLLALPHLYHTLQCTKLPVVRCLLRKQSSQKCPLPGLQEEAEYGRAGY